MSALLRVSGGSHDNVVADVVFVHGIQGDPRRTWTNKDGEFWPSWLAEDNAELAVWSVGYEAAVSGWTGTAMALYDRANNILAELTAAGLGVRPICWVTHSMGGLLVKYMLRNADSLAREFKPICDATRCVVFIATPHTGSDMASLGRYLGFFLRLTPAAKELQALSSPLRELNTWYRENHRGLGVATQVFFETQATRGVRVVDLGSSDPGLEGVTPIGLDADHLSICRPLSRDDLIYKRIRAFILSAVTPSPVRTDRHLNRAHVPKEAIARPPLLYEAFGSRLGSLLLRAGLDAQGVAEELSAGQPGSAVTTRLVERWLTGERAPSPEQCQALVALLTRSGIIRTRGEADQFTGLMGLRLPGGGLPDLETDAVPGDPAAMAGQKPAQAASDFSLIRQLIRDFGPYIRERSEGFTGRQFLFRALDEFIAAQPSGGYFLIQGEPGIGKTAFAAQLVRTRPYVRAHHFNIARRGIRSAEAFLSNVCAQLIYAYRLAHFSLGPDRLKDSGFLSVLLDEISAQAREEPCVIVVDALDEADRTGTGPETNVLCLPETLPAGVFVLATQRRTSDGPSIQCARRVFDLIRDSQDNLGDIRQYLEAALGRPQLHDYLISNQISQDTFVAVLSEKSQGNFMYLRCVIPEIERGAYRSLDIDHLPAGLTGYYDDHWRRMRGLDEASWFAYRLRVLCVLALLDEPAPVALISKLSRANASQVRTVLSQWEGLLHEEPHGDGTRYVIYHASFQEYLRERQEIGDEQVDIPEVLEQMADLLRREHDL